MWKQRGKIGKKPVFLDLVPDLTLEKFRIKFRIRIQTLPDPLIIKNLYKILPFQARGSIVAQKVVKSFLFTWKLYGTLSVKTLSLHLFRIQIRHGSGMHPGSVPLYGKKFQILPHPDQRQWKRAREVRKLREIFARQNLKMWRENRSSLDVAGVSLAVGPGVLHRREQAIRVVKLSSL